MNLFQIQANKFFSKMLNTVSENKDQQGPQSEEGHVGALPGPLKEVGTTPSKLYFEDCL